MQSSEVGKKVSMDTLVLKEQKDLEEMAKAQLDEATYIGYDTPLNDAQELYCQMRSQGFTKTKAARIAYPNGQHPGKYGHLVEKKLKVKERILELKGERAEISDGIDLKEQIRRANDIYMLCMQTGKVALALKALEMVNGLAGYDISRSENTKLVKEKPLADSGDTVAENLQKFSSILESHGTRPKHQN